MSSDPCTWPRLKSSSSIRGEEALLTDEFAKKLGYAFALWLAARKETTPDRLTIAVGHDPRASGPRLKAAFIDGLTAAARDAGVSPSAPTAWRHVRDLLPPRAPHGLRRRDEGRPAGLNRFSTKCSAAASTLRLRPSKRASSRSAHSDDVIAQTVEAARGAFAEVAKHL